jgi:uncharacterized membrane protein
MKKLFFVYAIRYMGERGKTCLEYVHVICFPVVIEEGRIMNSVSWKKRLSVLSNRLYLYPKPEPMPRSRLFWLALGMVTVVVLLFCSYFILFMTAQHDAFLTNAEDLGIMDQAVWNTLHGNVLHMTICNMISDTNCATPAGYTRFAIHFEPILFPISWIYFFWPSPKTLLVIQTLVVGAGAYPAFLLARLRLRSDLAGVALALLYLLYPALQQAVVYDFHAVTLSAALLMFMLYFMYTRRTVWMFVFAILAMATKEEMPLVIIMVGLWTIVFQRRWKSGTAIIALSVAWFAISFGYIIPHFSPTGQHLLISRYDDAEALVKQYGILQLLRHPHLLYQPYILEPNHAAYLHILFAPAGYIPLPGKLPSLYLLFFAPWIVVISLPSFLVNLLSSTSNMYSGLFQYSAEIVPVMVFAAIEAMVLILWVAQVVVAHISSWRKTAAMAEERTLPPSTASRRHWENGRMLQSALLVALLSFSVFSAMRLDYSFHGELPFSDGFQWPMQTQHTALAQKFFTMIPNDAVVSAQTKLVPHLSQRKTIYMFPYGVQQSEYIMLDVTGDVYPYYGSTDYIREVKTVLRSGQFGIVAAQDGYLLLKRGLPAPILAPYTPAAPDGSFNAINNGQLGYILPSSFCSYVQGAPKDIPNPVQQQFTSSSGGSISLLGSSVGAPETFSHGAGYMSVNTYWRVNSPIDQAMQVVLFMQDSQGHQHFVSADFPDVYWCQTNTWKPGATITLKSKVFGIQGVPIPNGIAKMSIALVPLTQPSYKVMDSSVRLPVKEGRVGQGTSKGANKGTNAVEIKTFNIVS